MLHYFPSCSWKPTAGSLTGVHRGGWGRDQARASALPLGGCIINVPPESFPWINALLTTPWFELTWSPGSALGFWPHLSWGGWLGGRYSGCGGLGVTWCPCGALLLPAAAWRTFLASLSSLIFSRRSAVRATVIYSCLPAFDELSRSKQLPLAKSAQSEAAPPSSGSMVGGS